MVRVARCFKLKNDKLCFYRRKLLDFTICSFNDLKPGKLLKKFSKISSQKFFFKRPNFFFGLENAKPGNPGDGGGAGHLKFAVLQCTVQKVKKIPPSQAILA